MAKAWNAMDPLSTISDDSDSDSEGGRNGEAGSKEDEGQEDRGEEANPSTGPNRTIGDGSEAASKKPAAGAAPKRPAVSYEVLAQHGYQGGLSVLNMPPPRPEGGDPSWEWSQGKRKAEGGGEDEPESFEERERLRQTMNDGSVEVASRALAEFENEKTRRKAAAEERKAVSFAQKEKRKRDMGQASRGKNYVEEEKRLLRDSGVYSGFDT